jgi:predicted amidophosphoribosyltransferase
MALIPCPECQGNLSPAARACPHCGHPIKKEREEEERETDADVPGCMDFAEIFVVIVVVIFLVFSC